MKGNELELHLNITAKFELINGAVKYGIIDKQVDSNFYKSDYYFISLQNLNTFRKAVAQRNYEFCKSLMEKINVKFIRSVTPI
ncbi:MAG: hypothetical protein KBB64_05480 [Bacteroidia bacterium]|jgi:hypothetical protein|nr:hypothetical protein [Bacteroidia bacterium]